MLVQFLKTNTSLQALIDLPTKILNSNWMDVVDKLSFSRTIIMEVKTATRRDGSMV